MTQSTGRRVQLTGHHEIIKEKWFQSGEALIRPFRIALDVAYPLQVRISTLPKYDPEKATEHSEKLNRAKTFLYEQRNIVNNKWLPRYDIRLGAPSHERGSEADRAHAELCGLLIDGCLDRLCENLGAYAPMLLPQKQADEVTPTLLGICEIESKRLREFLDRYDVKLRPGFVFVADDLEA